MSIQAGRVANLNVGTPPAGMLPLEDEDCEAIDVSFHDFANLPTRAGEKVSSPEFTCFGYPWRILLAPGGGIGAREGISSVYLKQLSNVELVTAFMFTVRDCEGKVVAHSSHEYNFPGRSSSGKRYNGKRNFAKRWRLLEALTEEEALKIEVRMQVHGEEEEQSSAPFIPSNPIYKNILKKFMDEESADVVFEVTSGNNEMKNDCGKQAKTTTAFHAHHLILQDGAPTLADLCKPGGGDGTAVPISNVRPEIFRHLLHYVYGGKVPDEELRANAKEIIDAADKYGVVNLKLQAEASYVESITFATENILDNLLYADAMNCALLKEAAMDFIVDKKNDIIGKVSFDNVPGSMVTDVLTAMARGEAEDDGDSIDPSDYTKIRVGTLRKMLHEKGLDVDGSRETMISRLKDNL